MKRLLAIILTAVIAFTACACSKTEQLPELTGDISGLSSKLENSFELQKSIFEAKIVSVSERDMLIPKYNFDLTKYTIYSVEITDSLDGITPLGNATLVMAGSSEEFVARLSLKKGETYILTAEPWVYGSEIVYLLSIFTSDYPRLDSAGRLVMQNEDGKLTDYGTKEDYLKSFADERSDYEQKNPGFFEPQNALLRYESIFDNVLEVNSKSWLRDGFKYDWTPSDEFVENTVSATKQVCDAIDALKQNPAITNADLTAILSMFNFSLY